MAITVSKELEERIAERVQSGNYGSVDEFLRETIERADEYRDQLRVAIEAGTAHIERGETVSGPEVFEAIRERRARSRPKG